MRFTNIIAAAAAFIAGTSAAVIQRDGARLAQFRIFGAEGCSDLNYGFYTVDESDANACHSFAGLPEGTTVNSVLLQVMTSPAADGCNFYLYTDAECSAGRRSLSVGVCNNPSTSGTPWQAWQISCPNGSA
ncbi:hypothetical protein AAE478_008831 [Parahypoxylon ruwenzoriense]